MFNEKRILEKKKETVLVLGSKPSAKMPITDYTYCANASASYYSEEIKKRKNVTSIVSASEVILGTRSASKEKDEWIKDRTSRIANLFSKEIILYAIDNFPDAIEVLKQHNCKIPIKLVTSSQMFSLIKHFTGKNVPILTINHFKNNNVLMILLRYLKNLLRLYFFSGKNIHGIFRPSTGVATLIYAISKHGNDAEYIISGISIEKRGDYPDGSNNTWTPKINLKKNHIIVDKEILTFLSKKYKLKSYDIELKNISKFKK